MKCLLFFIFMVSTTIGFSQDVKIKWEDNQVTGQMNHQTADPKANASVFLFFPTAHFLKTILASRTNGSFGFANAPKNFSSLIK